MFDYSDDEMISRFTSNRRVPLPTSTVTETQLKNGKVILPQYKYATKNLISEYKGLDMGPNAVFQNAGLNVSRQKFNPFCQSKSCNKDNAATAFAVHEQADDHPDSFFKSIKSAVQLAQFFALMPVTGYGGPNYRSIRFRWTHWKTIYFFLASSGIIAIFACSMFQNLKNGIRYDKTGGYYANCITSTNARSRVRTCRKLILRFLPRYFADSAVLDGLVFYGIGISANFLFLQLSKNWSLINKSFAEMEFKFRKYDYPNGITRKFKITISVFMMIALIEHLLSRLAELIRTLPCARDKYISSITEAFFTNYYYDIFSLTSYNVWKGILLFTLHFMCTFTWNFMDLILALIGWSISRRFKQLNNALFKVQGKERDSYFWKEKREDYNELTNLTRKVDFHIQKLMLLSLGDNLYFICIQLLKGLNKSGNFYESIYFLWSVGFLIMRICFVAFTAAGINDESKEAKTVLYSVPEKSYCAETRRFLTQLSTNEVALTGCRFFSITRGLILTIAGTVVTYEVILVQFNTDVWNPAHNKTNCLYV